MLCCNKFAVFSVRSVVALNVIVEDVAVAFETRVTRLALNSGEVFTDDNGDDDEEEDGDDDDGDDGCESSVADKCDLLALTLVLLLLLLLLSNEDGEEVDCIMDEL